MDSPELIPFRRDWRSVVRPSATVRIDSSRTPAVPGSWSTKTDGDPLGDRSFVVSAAGAVTGTAPCTDDVTTMVDARPSAWGPTTETTDRPRPRRGRPRWAARSKVGRPYRFVDRPGRGRGRSPRRRPRLPALSSFPDRVRGRRSHPRFRRVDPRPRFRVVYRVVWLYLHVVTWRPDRSAAVGRTDRRRRIDAVQPPARRGVALRGLQRSRRVRCRARR